MMLWKIRSAVIIRAACVLFLASTITLAAQPLEGEVVDASGGEVALRIPASARLHPGDEIELTYMAGGMELKLGVYRVLRVDGTRVAGKVVSGAIPPSPQMKVLVYMSDQAAPPIVDADSPAAGSSKSTVATGQVVEVAGTDVRIKLDSPGVVNAGNRVELAYVTTAGMEMTVGTWSVARVEGGGIWARVVDSATGPRVGLRATIYPQGSGARETGSAADGVNDRGESGTAGTIFSSDFGGKKGPVDLASIQSALKAMGYAPGRVDGVMDEATRRAIEQFQKDEGLPVDGRPGHDLSWELHLASLDFGRYIEDPAGESYRKGRDFFFGRNGQPQDYERAATFLRQAAEQGHSRAQNMLGAVYGKGLGVQPDYAEAVKWYRRAADQDLANGQYNLAVMYANGHGVPRDLAEAERWFRLAANQGYASAQYNLGYMYKQGLGVPQDFAAAVVWLRKAAEQNLAPAQYVLGLMYAGGLGLTRDETAAVEWFRRAAAQNYTKAQEELRQRGLSW
jgi:peptidoglycan hydrolase-like protein with peptidoglycan-binding domain